MLRLQQLFQFNAWPERGAWAAKRIKSQSRSTMKMELLNALLIISMNGRTNNSKEATLIMQKLPKDTSHIATSSSWINKSRQRKSKKYICSNH